MKQETKLFLSWATVFIMVLAASGLYPQGTGRDDKKSPDKDVKKEDNKTPGSDKKSADKKTEEKTAGDKTGKDKSADTKKDDTKPGDKQKTDAATDEKTKADEKAKQDKKAKEEADEKKKVEKLESTLNFGIQKDRRSAINAIKDIKDPEAQKRLIKKVIEIVENDADMEVRKTAITVLGDLKVAEAGPALIKVLDDDSEDLKIAACYAIGRLKITDAKTRLIEILKKQDMTKDSNFTDAIITALDELGAPELTPFAVEIIKDTKNSKMAREKLLLFIGKNGSKEQKDFLLEIFKDEEQEIIMRSYAVKSIAKLKITEAAGDIKEVIKEIDSYPFNKKKKYYDLYINAVAALAQMGDKDAIPLLIDSLRSDNAAVRLKAINLIKEFNDERTIDILKYKMENDPSASVRKAARKALEEKGIIEKSKEDDTKDTKGTEEDNNGTEEQREE